MNNNFYNKTIRPAIRSIIYVIEFAIMMQIFRLSYIEAGATNLTNREFYTFFPYLLMISALYGLSLNITTNIRQTGLFSPNIFWIILCLWLGISFNVPPVTGSLSAWMIVHAIFIFTDADCYEYGFLEPFSDILFPLRNYGVTLEKGYMTAKKREILYFILGNACIHILYLTGFLTFLIKLFY